MSLYIMYGLLVNYNLMYDAMKYRITILFVLFMKSVTAKVLLMHLHVCLANYNFL